MSETYSPVKEGKVREIYDIGDSLILVATDRISCFDVILNNTVTKKGTVLTQMSRFWFDMTKDILPNHMISTDVNDMPEFFRTSLTATACSARSSQCFPSSASSVDILQVPAGQATRKTAQYAVLSSPRDLRNQTSSLSQSTHLPQRLR